MCVCVCVCILFCLVCLQLEEEEEEDDDVLPFVHDTFVESSTRGIVQGFIETANYGLLDNFSFKQHKSNNQFHSTRNNVFLRWRWVSWDFYFILLLSEGFMLHDRWMKGENPGQVVNPCLHTNKGYRNRVLNIHKQWSSVPLRPCKKTFLYSSLVLDFFFQPHP
jgi:hypothetical protein